MSDHVAGLGESAPLGELEQGGLQDGARDGRRIDEVLLTLK